MSRGTRATISRSALLHNFQRVRQYAPQSKIWTVVKANAYGHGANRIVDILSESDGFAVSTLDEGLALRAHGVRQPVMLLEGVTEAEHLHLAVEQGLQCVLHCPSQLQQLEQVILEQPLQVWVKIDTGMHRLGFTAEQCKSLWQTLGQIPQVRMIGAMTHFASADDMEQDSATLQQIRVFQRLSPTGLTSSMANSAAIIRHPSSHAEWVRPGIMLYGASPIADHQAAAFNLKPVMSFESPVIAVRTVNAGVRIGYGLRWQAQRDSKIATLAVGYGDGYPRHAPDGTPVWLNGQRVPIAGRVSMDMLMLDVTDLPAVQVGDRAELWGEHLSVDEVASHIGSIGYELLTRLSSRVDYKIVD
ncbi:MAG: alanine racemase [Reinekea sp.]